MAQLIVETSLDDTLPKRRAFASSSAGEELLVRDPVSGQVHFLNPAAAAVWECCDGATTLRTCADHLRAEFDVPEETDLAADIRETIADFAQQGLLDAPRADA